MSNQKKALVPALLLVGLALPTACAELDLSDGPLDPTVSNDLDATAHTPALNTLVADADVAFQGEVVSVGYRTSAVMGEGDVPLPHTLVTYRVIRGITGGQPGEEITLRFLGGPAADGRVLFVPDLPLFDVGDTDVLLVEGNGTRWCPLLGCADGRLRVVDDVLFTDDGRELSRGDRGQLIAGPRYDLEEARANVVAGHVVSRVHSNPARKVAGGFSANALRIEALHASLDEALGEASSRSVSAAQFGVALDTPFAVRP